MIVHYRFYQRPDGTRYMTKEDVPTSDTYRVKRGKGKSKHIVQVTRDSDGKTTFVCLQRGWTVA